LTGPAEHGKKTTSQATVKGTLLAYFPEHIRTKAAAMTGDARFVFTLLGLTILLFAGTRVRVDVIALLVITAFALGDVLTLQEVVAGFGNSTLVLIAILFVVGDGLVRTGVAMSVGNWLMRVSGNSETRLLILLILSVAILGTFMSSTGVVAIFIPVILGICSKTDNSPSRLMMPMAYAALASGMLTLIAGMLPFATALQKSGGIDLIVEGLMALLGEAGPIGMMAGLFVLTAMLGLFVSNTATAVLMAPIAIGAAQEMGVSPYPFALTVILAASAAFVTPVSSPANTLVWGPGNYSFADFARLGLPLLLLVMLVSLFLVPFLFPLQTG